VTASKSWRNRQTKITYISFGTFGWYLYALGPSMDFLRTEQGTTAFVMSLHMAAVALGSIFGGVLTSYLSARIGRGQTLQLSGFAMAASLLLIVLGSSPAVTLAGALAMGVVSTSTVALTNSYLTFAHGAGAPKAIAEANLAAAVAGLVSPLVVGVAVGIGWGWRVGLIAAAASFAITELFRGDLNKYNEPAKEIAQKVKVKLSRRYWWMWALLFTTAGAEFSVALWNTTLLRERGGLGDAAAAAGLATFTGGMAVGRLLLARFADRFDPEKILVFSFVLPLISFWGIWALPVASVMLISLVLFGIGVGMHWPLGIARVVRAGGKHPDVASSRTAYATGAAGMVLPVVLGSLSDSFGVHTAFLIVPAVLAVGLALILLTPKAESEVAS
jgi:predicted MFS family arabinose efflux permease